MVSRWVVVCGIVAVLLGLCQTKLQRLYIVNTLFDEGVIVANFRAVHALRFPVRTVRTDGGPVAALPANPGGEVDLPATFEWNGTTIDLQAWLVEHWTTGLVVIKRDGDTAARVLHERYSLGNTAESRCVSWSMCKSVIATLVGIAVDEGDIGDVAVKTVTDYVPELKGTAYDGVTLKNVLQMSSGVEFGEDYFDPFSDINIMGYTLAFGWSIDDFVKSLTKRGREPGTFNHYVSMDTQVLAMVLKRATNSTTLTSYLESRMWSKVGFESSATWVLDNEASRMELAFGILGVTTRDWARLGWLYLNKGRSPSTGDSVVSEQWVDAALAADSPHLMPGRANTMSDYPSFGYGYQWWLGPKPENPDLLSADFAAIGVYGQMVYVSPADGIVIAKNAADPFYEAGQDPGSHENRLETQSFAACRAIAHALRDA